MDQTQLYIMFLILGSKYSTYLKIICCNHHMICAFNLKPVIRCTRPTNTGGQKHPPYFHERLVPEIFVSPLLNLERRCSNLSRNSNLQYLCNPTRFQQAMNNLNQLQTMYFRYSRRVYFLILGRHERYHTCECMRVAVQEHQ